MTDEFYKTRRGATFFDTTLPALIAEIERLNRTLERIAAALESKPSGGKDA